LDEGASDFDTIFLNIYKVDVDNPVINPTDITAYSNEDILWSAGRMQALPVASDQIAFNWELDVKSKRKLLSSDVIGFSARAATNAGSASWAISGIIRAIVAVA